MCCHFLSRLHACVTNKESKGRAFFHVTVITLVSIMPHLICIGLPMTTLIFIVRALIISSRGYVLEFKLLLYLISN